MFGLAHVLFAGLQATSARFCDPGVDTLMRQALDFLVSRVSDVYIFQEKRGFGAETVNFMQT